MQKTISNFYILLKDISQAFVKENEEQWLHDIAPTLTALINYLTRENNGIRVYTIKDAVHVKTGKTIYNMSNGLAYSTDTNSKWFVV
ncbi:MAG: hypothetical protein ABIR81_12420 [Ginsengibacter sp.]